MALAPHVLHDVFCKARDVAMIEVQRFTTGHAAPAPRFLNHFTGQAINALHNDVVMVLSHPHPVNIRRVFMHDDPLRVPNAFFVRTSGIAFSMAAEKYLIHTLCVRRVGPVFIVIGVCNRIIALVEVALNQQL